MPRIARVVVPNVPHHVTQRGNRKQRTFFCDRDYELYKELMAEWCARRGVQVWAYCLMPNHTHLIMVPSSSDALARAVGEAHRRYTSFVNRREGWTGFLWQGRFASFPMSDAYLWNAVRYILLNPVRAGLARKAVDWPHSSVRTHLSASSDLLVESKYLAGRIANWEDLLTPAVAETENDLFRLHQGTGRPLGDEAFVSRLEAQTGRRLRSRGTQTIPQERVCVPVRSKGFVSPGPGLGRK